MSVIGKAIYGIHQLYYGLVFDFKDYMMLRWTISKGSIGLFSACMESWWIGVWLQDDMFWNEDKSGNWEDTDMGTWMDETQENNSTWSSASGWNRGKKNIIKVKIGLGREL